MLYKIVSKQFLYYSRRLSYIQFKLTTWVNYHYTFTWNSITYMHDSIPQVQYAAGAALYCVQFMAANLGASLQWVNLQLCSIEPSSCHQSTFRLNNIERRLAHDANKLFNFTCFNEVNELPTHLPAPPFRVVWELQKFFWSFGQLS